jgi:acetolactate synthase-1/2/3 large subunit
LQKTCAERLVDALEAAGVRYIFGLPGGETLRLLEAVRHNHVRFVLTAHESAAGFMADVAGRITGLPGVCFSTLGPGATNLATGVGNAYLDRSPVIAITGQVKTAWMGRTVQMHVDHTQLFGSITKATLRLSPNNISEAVDTAIRIAATERPGPVHLDLSVDVAEAAWKGQDRSIRDFHPQAVAVSPSVADFDQAAALMSQASYPVIVLGLSMVRAKAFTELARFLERHGTPVLTTFMAKGLVAEDSPLCVGVLGSGSNERLRDFLARADLIVALGYDPVEVTLEDWAPSVPIVRADTVPSDLGPDYAVACDLVGDLKIMVGRLAELPPLSHKWDLSTLRRHTWQSLESLTAAVSGFAPHHVLKVLRQTLPRDGILTCDVGAHAHLVRQLWQAYEPGTLLVSNGWSSMGFSIPAAISAKLLAPQRQVACLTGDGGFLMMMGELWTAARLRLPIIFTVLLDRQLSLIRIRQERKGLSQYGTELFEAPAEPIQLSGGGVSGIVVSTEEEYRNALNEALARDHPTVIQALVDPSEYQFVV